MTVRGVQNITVMIFLLINCRSKTKSALQCQCTAAQCECSSTHPARSVSVNSCVFIVPPVQLAGARLDFWPSDPVINQRRVEEKVQGLALCVQGSQVCLLIFEPWHWNS